jgi:hypothetical protein
MEMKNVKIGEHAEQVRLARNYLLVRFIDVPLEKKKSSIIRLNQEEKDKDVTEVDLRDFKGFHPNMAEVVVVGETDNIPIKAGDIIIHSQRLRFKDVMQSIERVIVDNEILFRITTGDVVCVANHYRDFIDEGKIVNKDKFKFKPKKF